LPRRCIFRYVGGGGREESRGTYYRFDHDGKGKKEKERKEKICTFDRWGEMVIVYPLFIRWSKGPKKRDNASNWKEGKKEQPEISGSDL